MRAFLLAAGLGTRLRPITNTTPKCLVPIKERALIDYWFSLLFEAGIEKVLVNTHYLADQVVDHIQKSPWRDKIEHVHEDELLLTGGSILKNEAFFEGEPFIVAHADNLVRFSVKDFITRHETKPEGTHISMMTFTTDNPRSCGIVEEDADGIVQAFHEKVENPPGNHANGAVYIFDPEVIDFMKSFNKEKVDVSTEVLPAFMGKMITFHNDVYLRDIGTVESLQKAEEEFSWTLD